MYDTIVHCMTAYTNVWDCVLITDTNIVVYHYKME